MREEMRAYVAGEQRESLLAALLAVLALGVAFQLWRSASPYVWADVPLVVLAILQLVGAITHFAGASARRESLAVLLATDPGRFQTAELSRLHRAKATMRYSMGFDALVVLVGAAVAWARLGNAPWLGVGVALAVEGSILFLLDAWSSARAQAYLAHVRRFLTAAGARPTTTEAGDVAHE